MTAVPLRTAETRRRVLGLPLGPRRYMIACSRCGQSGKWAQAPLANLWFDSHMSDDMRCVR